jgi:hypothetical protein
MCFRDCGIDVFIAMEAQALKKVACIIWTVVVLIKMWRWKAWWILQGRYAGWVFHSLVSTMAWIGHQMLWVLIIWGSFSCIPSLSLAFLKISLASCITRLIHSVTLILCLMIVCRFRCILNVCQACTSFVVIRIGLICLCLIRFGEVWIWGVCTVFIWKLIDKCCSAW